MEGGREQTDLFFRKIKITLKLCWKGKRYKNYNGKFKMEWGGKM